MNEIVNWLLDLRTLRFGQEGVEFSFAHPLPAWGWALAVAAAGAIAWWSYRRLEGSVRWRAVFAGLRAAALVLLAVLIAGPRLLKPNETEEKDWVLVLADRSASMGIRDLPPISPSGSGVGRTEARGAREEELRGALERTSAMWQRLAKDRVVVWMGFDAGAFDLKASAAPAGTAAPSASPGQPGQIPVELGAPTGRRTAIGRAMEQALRRAAARPVAGVVVLSDGRSIDEPSKGVLRRLQSEKVPVFSVPLGSERSVADVSVRRAEGPKVAFVNDLVPIEAELERIGPPVSGAAAGEPWGKVQLIDTATGLVLDEQDVGGPDAGESAPPPGSANSAEAPATVDQVRKVVLTARPAAAGAGSWAVKFVPRPEARGGADGDLVQENNQATVELNLEDRPLRVLYFDGYPRWEYRYLKNLFSRERSIASGVLLLSEGRRFVQEGTQTITSLPASPEEWRAFDVVILGDVRPDLFTEEQLAQLRDHVGIDGAGVLWIGGEGATPAAWASTGMADLLPFSLRAGDSGGSSGSRAGVDPWPEPVLMRPTATAERYGVLRMTDSQQDGAAGPMRWWPKELADATLGWPRLRWAQRIDPGSLKPTTEVLAEGVLERFPGSGRPPDVAPLVLSMRFGAGRVVYVGTDEIWRWRFGRGEQLPERFWLQMVRMLGRESLARSGQAARVEVSPSRAEINQPLRVAVELLDQRLADSGASSLAVRLIRLGDHTADAATVADLALTPEGIGQKRGVGSRTYAGTWVPNESGKYRVEVTDPLLATERLSAEFEVWLPEDELRRPETDHPFLARLSEATGGKVLGVNDLAGLEQLLPNRRLRLVGTPEEETLWDTPLALILLMSLLTVEWVGRRLLKLA